MIKRLITVTTLVLLSYNSALAYADDEIAYNTNQLGKGRYIGVNVGYNQTHMNFTNGYSASNSVEPVYVYDNSLSKRNGAAGVFIGYGESENRLYIAGEIGLQANSTNMDYSYVGPTSGNTYAGKLKMTNYANADLIPGYFITPSVLAYGRIGYSYSQLKIDQTKNGIKEYSESGALHGGRLGVGTAFSVTDKLSLGVDYIYTFYDRNSFDEAKNNSGVSTESLHMHPYSNYFGLRAQYSI